MSATIRAIIATIITGLISFGLYWIAKNPIDMHPYLGLIFFVAIFIITLFVFVYLSLKSIYN